MSKHKKKKNDSERRLKRAARKRLRSRYLFKEFLRAMKKLGLVGEEQNALVVFVVAMSCILDRPLNIFVKGHSAAGKNWLVTRVLKLFPKSAILEITSASEQAWSYLGSAFRHCVVYLQERNEAVGAMDPMRLLISEGKLVRIVTGYEGGKLVTNERTAYGPVAAISTTTKNRLKIDDETRHMSIWVDESEEQTRKILTSQFSDAGVLCRKELETWRMVHRILRQMISAKVVFPKWFEEVSKKVFAGDLRVRRYFPAFIEACRTVCLIRSFQPGRKHRNGALEVDFADFAITTLIFDRVFVESLPPLGKAAGEATRRHVEKIVNGTGKPVRARDLARELHISMDQAYGKLRYAARAGVIRLANKPERSNRKKYWPVPAPRFVPDPKTMFQKLRFKNPVSFVHPLTGEHIVYKPRH
jgi:hypothetical protein